MKQAVLLLSGGLDSAANLVLGGNQFRVCLALTIDYGQRGAQRETQKAKVLAERYGVEHITFDLGSFSGLIGAKSALLGGQDVPSPQSLDDLSIITKTASAVWVPNRNGVLISLAAALAEGRGLNAVAVGFNAEEAVTFPDNTPDFMHAMTQSLRFSTSNHVEIISSTARLNKVEIVRELGRRDFQFELLWSCYHSAEYHCGQCESCQRLARALNVGLVTTDQREWALQALFGPRPLT